MFHASEILPMMAGTIAPPIIDITSREDPSFVYDPRFFRLRAKIVGNMMEWKNPISTIAQTGAWPDASKTTSRQTSDPPANKLSSLGAGTFCMMAEIGRAHV